MTTAAIPAADSRWPEALLSLALAIVALLALFARDVADMTHIWWTSTTFGHCLFVLPVVGWLIWTRRSELRRLAPVGWWPGLSILATGGAMWLIGDAGTLALLRHFGLVTMIQGAVVAILGPHVARGSLFPLCYLWFAVPFGDQMEPPLQALTVRMVMPLLSLAGIPAASDGVLIHAGRYWFRVAEACSGAKFVLAMLAYGALVANTCFRFWTRRALFMGAALVIPVLANALRAFATMWAADRTDVERATGFDHIVYGWVFFALVMALLMAIGWRGFDRAPDDSAFDPAALPPPRSGRVPSSAAAGLVIALALAFPAWSAATAGSVSALPARIALPEVPGWSRVPLDRAAPWQPHYPAADHFLIGRYGNARGDRIDLSIAAFARQREGAELVAFGTGVLREGDVWLRVADVPAIAGGRAMRIRAPGPGGVAVERIVATWYRIGDDVTADGGQVKLATMKARLLGGDQTAVAVHVAARVQPGRDPRAAIAAFAAAAGGVERLGAIR